MDRAFYSESFINFLASPSDQVLDSIITGSVKAGVPVRDTQLEAWKTEIELLRSWLAGRDGSIYFEYTIPRMGRRIDVVLLVGQVVVVAEFKVGEADFSRDAREQVWDYALDLKNFHESSHYASIAPILVATGATNTPVDVPLAAASDGVWDPIRADPGTFTEVLQAVLERSRGLDVDRGNWESGRYAPTPTIVEAARSLYSGHSVADISRSDAGALNLTKTSSCIEQIIQNSKVNGEKAICLVTGVPGAGKTLVGLNVATTHRDSASVFHSVYLSGNGPLVKVLSEALARDKFSKSKESGEKLGLPRCRSEVKAFIQNVHSFRDEYLDEDQGVPAEHVTIFDEAQRAWNVSQTSHFMQRRKGHPNFTLSEPEVLLSAMNRHQDWAVVICLVGGGQEINTGEGGISEWVSALNRSFPHWHVYTSNRLADSEYRAIEAIDQLRARKGVAEYPELHLATSMRSFRAENVSSLIRSLLDLDVEGARRSLEEANRYPIVITRELQKARTWLRKSARGSERVGIVVSSSAERLKPHAIDVRAPVDPVHWFLDGKDDTRSSDFLEDAATEFQVQGLELDWTCVAWDADLRNDGRSWQHWSFGGSRWKKVHKPVRKQFLENAYRVLLTRARQGMAIVVPEGDPEDSTRLPMFYDSTYDYLRKIGFTEI